MDYLREKIQRKPMQKHSHLIDLVSKYVVAAILIVVPLYPKFPFIRIPNTFVAVRLEDFLLFFAGIVLVVSIFPRLLSFSKDPLVKLVALFLGVGFISFISGSLVTKSVVPNIAFLHWLRRIEYFIPLFLGIDSMRKNTKNLEFYLKILFLVIIVLFFYGFGQKNFGWPIIITQNQEYSKGIALSYVPGSHINSTFAGHYDLASFLVLALPVVISCLFLLKGVRTKIFLGMVFFSGLWLLVNTASRVSIFSYLIAGTISLLLIKKYKAVLVFLFVSIVFVGFSSNLVSRYSRLIDVIRNKSESGNLNNLGIFTVYAQDIDLPLKVKSVTPTPTSEPPFEDRSTNIRLNVEWPRALRAFAKNPILGTGYSSITLATDNDYLRALGEVGILGFLAFFLNLGKTSDILLRSFSSNKSFRGVELGFLTGTIGSLSGLFINAVFIDIFESSKFALLFWLMIGMAMSLVTYAKNE